LDSQVLATRGPVVKLCYVALVIACSTRHYPYRKSFVTGCFGNTNHVFSYGSSSNS